jgi:hypothetical protein
MLVKIGQNSPLAICCSVGDLGLDPNLSQASLFLWTQLWGTVFINDLQNVALAQISIITRGPWATSLT